MDKILDFLKKHYGITTIEELEKAIEESPGLDLSIFVLEKENKTWQKQTA